MPIDADAITQCADRAARVGDVRDGTVLVARSGSGAVAVTIETTQPIIVRSACGLELACGGKTELRTPTGWVRARESEGRDVVVEPYPVRMVVAPWTMHPAPSPLTVCDADLVQRLHAMRLGESPLQRGVLVEFADAAYARSALLAMGVHAQVVRRRPTSLVIEQPHAARYAREVGMINPATQRFLELGAALADPVVDARAQTAITRLFGEQGLDEMMLTLRAQQSLRELRDVSALAMVGELTAADARRAIALLGALPARDVLRRTALRTLLRAQCGRAWTVRIASARRGTTRMPLARVRGADHLANGFVVRGA